MPKLTKRKFACLPVTSRVIELSGLVRLLHIIAPGKAEGPRLGVVGGWLRSTGWGQKAVVMVTGLGSGLTVPSDCSNISFPVCLC